MDRDTPKKQFTHNRYNIAERVGTGGFAEVWRATDSEGGPDVVVKFPKYDGSNEKAVVKSRFKNAYKTLCLYQQCIHPTSIVHFLEGQKNSPPYIITEYIQGSELTSFINKNSLDYYLENIKTFGIPIGRALSFLHQNECVYLDLKPSNILIREENRYPVLIDFNVAERDTASETLFYEDDYKAPEQLPEKSEDVNSGPYTDVYALGKILVYLVTGKSIPTTETPPAGIDVREFNDAVPSRISNVIKSATALDPHDRPETATALVTQLLDALGEKGGVAKLIDDRNNIICPIRDGDTVGRIHSRDAQLPGIAISDPDNYVSPVQFKIEYKNGWLIEDKSINGTYKEMTSGYQRLLSKEGYEELKAKRASTAPTDQPPTTARISTAETLLPVNPEYSISLELIPE